MTCSQPSNFPTAGQMEQLATNYPVIWEEICMLQQAILAASSQCQPGGGQMSVTVGGTTPMTFLAGVTSVTVINGGSGYYIDTPAVQFVSPNGGAGTGATGTLTITGGEITAVNITNGGTGYQPVNSTMAVSSVGGVGANIQPLVNGNGNIVNYNIVSGGTGYTVNDTVTATRAVPPNIAYTDAVFKITGVSLTGQIVSIAILNPGSGYQPSVAGVSIVSTINNTIPYPLGVGFNASVITNNTGVITQVVVNNPGAGYVPDPPQLVINDPGTGATTTVQLTGTAVSSITVTNPGSNYTQSATGMVNNPPTAPAPVPAVVKINVSTNTFGTTPTLYWQVWTGAVTNPAIQAQLNAVLTYFTSLGYTIQIQSNPNTTNTIQWFISW